MTELPRVTVVTVTRNDLTGLKKTIASTQAQEYEFVEQLVIDGASTDGSPEWLASHISEIPFRYVSEPDRGIYDAMNKAILIATGDILIFMNSGDIFTDSLVLREVTETWIEHRWHWAYGAIRFVNESGIPSQAYVHAPFARRRFELGHRYVPHQATFIETAFLRERLYPFDVNLGVSADQDMAMRASNIAPPFVIVRFVADFLEGGAHSLSSDRARELRWHAARRKNGVLLFNSRLADRSYAEVLAAWRRLRRNIRARVHG